MKRNISRVPIQLVFVYLWASLSAIFCSFLFLQLSFSASCIICSLDETVRAAKVAPSFSTWALEPPAGDADFTGEGLSLVWIVAGKQPVSNTGVHVCGWNTLRAPALLCVGETKCPFCSQEEPHGGLLPSSTWCSMCNLVPPLTLASSHGEGPGGDWTKAGLELSHLPGTEGLGSSFARTEGGLAAQPSWLFQRHLGWPKRQGGGDMRCSLALIREASGRPDPWGLCFDKKPVPLAQQVVKEPINIYIYNS